MAPTTIRAQRQLNVALGARDYEGVRRAVRKGADPNFMFNHTLPPLWSALRVGDEKLAEVLLECGARVEFEHNVLPNMEPFNALSYAMVECTFKQVRFCFDHSSIGVDAVHHGQRLLVQAIVNDHRELFAYLVDRGADLNCEYMGLLPLEYCFVHIEKYHWFATMLAGEGCKMHEFILRNEKLIKPVHLRWLARHMPHYLDFDYVGWICANLHCKHALALFKCSVQIHPWHLCGCIKENPFKCMGNVLVRMFTSEALNTVYDREGYLPVHCAIMAQNIDMLDAIIKYGGMLLNDKAGMTCVEIAEWNCEDAFVRYVVACKAVEELENQHANIVDDVNTNVAGKQPCDV